MDCSWRVSGILTVYVLVSVFFGVYITMALYAHAVSINYYYKSSFLIFDCPNIKLISDAHDLVFILIHSLLRLGRCVWQVVNSFLIGASTVSFYSGTVCVDDSQCLCVLQKPHDIGVFIHPFPSAFAVQKTFPVDHGKVGC